MAHEEIYHTKINRVLREFFTYQSVFSVHIKNWDPFVFGPEFAIDKTPMARN